MSSDFGGTIGGNRHYPTGTTEGSLVVCLNSANPASTEADDLTLIPRACFCGGHVTLAATTMTVLVVRLSVCFSWPESSVLVH